MAEDAGAGVIARLAILGDTHMPKGKRELPADFAAQEPQTDARFAFFAGAKNLCFLPESQERSFKFFNSRRKNYHSLHVFPEYGHLDVFMGERAERDTFPLLLAELEKPR
jgi:hypothetical protein